MIRTVYIILSLIILTSCIKEKEDRKSIMDTALQAKVQKYKSKKLNACKTEFMEEINIEVDSMMYFLVEKMNGNSEDMPPRPPRPGRLVDTITLDKKN